VAAQLPFALVNGLASGMALFLVAAGLTLVFGMLRILNFSHGAFFMLGAYVAYTLLASGGLSGGEISMPAYIGASVAAGVVVGLLGLVSDRLVLRRLRNYDEAYMLIATFGLLMLCQGVVQMIWGVEYHSVNPPDALSGIVQIGGMFVPVYLLFVIGMGLAVFVALDLAIHRMWIGKLVQALANDPWITSLLGVNVPLAFTSVVVVAFMLAGLAGGLLLPNQTLSPVLGNAFTMQAFVAVIIGGLGSIRGAFLAAILLGCADSISLVLLPNTPGLAIYITMIVFLLCRPQGLLARSGT
jgi:branched-subunit amino acid ABC-type transport system permease component